MHKEYTMLMSAELDGEATPAEAQRLREHVRACAACAAVWQQWQAADRRLGAGGQIAPPVDFTERVLQRLDAAELRRRRIRWLGSGLVLGWLSLMAIAAVLVILVLPWFLGNAPQIAQLKTVAVQMGEAVLLLLRGVLTALASLGAPVLAAVVGLIACATCVLGATWLKLLSQRGYQFGVTIPVT